MAEPKINIDIGMIKRGDNGQAMDLAQFRKLDADGQLRALRGARLERVFAVERDSADKEARTIKLSISSELPYERWWGIEVLDHGSKSIRTERLRSGAPLLVGHDTSDQVGVVEGFEITPGRKLQVTARFSKSARAEEIWQDVLDGIRRNTSVGYIIHELVLEKQEDGINTYRVTDWEPYEGSLVAVPADPSVGVGRALQPGNAPQPKEERIMADHVATPTTSAQTAADAAAIIARELDRVNGILAAGDNYKDFDGPKIARELIKDPTATLATFNERVLAYMRANPQKPLNTAQPGEPISYGQGARQIIRYSQLRAFTKPIHFTDGTKMAPEEAAYRSAQWLMATVYQQERAKKWCQERGIFVEQRVMTTAVGNLGGYLVPDEMEQSIIDLRAQVGLARRLTRRRAMGSDTKSLPRRTGGVVAYFIEEDNSGVTASDKGWDNVNLVAKTLAALSLISKNLEEDAIIDVVDDLAMEQAYAFATKEDQCWLIGDGTSTYGGMQGLLTLFNNTAYASRITAATNHDTFAEYDNADLSAVMAGVADFPGMNPSWVCSKTFAENCFGRLKRVAGGNNGGDLDRRYAYGYGGYPADTSDIMPKDGTSAVTTVEALFGDFSKSSSFGDRRGIMIEVLRERYAEKLQLGILGHERFQIVNHDLGTTSAKGPVAALKGE